MLNLKILNLILIICCSASPFAGPTKIKQGEIYAYKFFRQAARNLKNLDDGQNTLFISIGASPLSIAAAVEAASLSEQVIRIPLSEVWDASRSAKIESINGDRERWLMAYFDYFLNSALKLRPTRILIFDYAQTGGTIPLIKDYFQHYFNKSGINSDSIKVAGFCGEGVPYDEFVERWTTEKIGRIEIPLVLNSLLSSRHFSRCRTHLRFPLFDWFKWSAQHQNLNEAEYRNELALKIKSQELKNGYAELVEQIKTRADPCVRQLNVTHTNAEDIIFDF